MQGGETAEGRKQGGHTPDGLGRCQQETLHAGDDALYPSSLHEEAAEARE